MDKIKNGSLDYQPPVKLKPLLPDNRNSWPKKNKRLLRQFLCVLALQCELYETTHETLKQLHTSFSDLSSLRSQYASSDSDHMTCHCTTFKGESIYF